MDDLISRQAAIALCEYRKCDLSNPASAKILEALGELAKAQTINITCDILIGEINALPAADAKPVVRGKWVEMGQNKDETHNIRCGVCGEGIKSKGHANSYYTKHKYRYCPYCGADMRGGKGE